MPPDIILGDGGTPFDVVQADDDDTPPASMGDYPWAAAGGTRAEPPKGKVDLEVTFAWTLAGKPVPERPWIVKDWIPRRQVTLLNAPGGEGKSQLALQLGVAATSGTRWLGLDVEQVPAFAIFAEDDDAELHIRLSAIAKVTHVNIADLRQLVWRSAVIDPAELVEVTDRGTVVPTAYFDWMKRTVQELGSRLIILDAATNLFGGDEIKRRQVNGFLVLLRRLAVDIDGAILLLSHPSAQGISTKSGMSGSTHWSNGVRSRLYLERDEGEDADPDIRILTRKKSNYATAGETLRMRWAAGAFIPIGGPEPMDKAEISSRNDSVFLSLLGKTAAEGAVVCPSLTARNYAPTVFAKHPGGQGIPRRAFEQAMNRLLEAGAIKIEEYGRPSDRRKKLVLA